MLIKKSTILLGSLVFMHTSLGVNAAPIDFNPVLVQASPTLYHMPFKGEDLKATEKIYRGKKIHSNSGSQKYGYDLGAKRYDFLTNKWTGLKAGGFYANNSDWVTFNKKIYAMRSGKVIACWRNAPNNPRPKLSGDTEEGKEWLHWALKAGLVSGGGNHLWVEHSDGSRMLYAHAAPGSIPLSLCPHNGTLFPKKPSSSSVYTAVPTHQQAIIKAGQLLGKVGNGGSSTGPHLHIHLENNKQAKKIIFKKGLSALVDNNNPYGKWTRFAGKQMTPGPVLIWPARTLKSEYARHGFQQSGFQALFDHLADSGYKPVWLDGYAVNGKPFYNMIWRPANIKWRAFFGKSSAGYQSVVDKAKQDGFVPVQVDVHKKGNGVRYNVIFEKKNMGWYARHNLSYNQHLNAIQTAKSLGMKPVNVAVASVNGQRRYTVLYHKKSIGSWVMKSKLSSNAYQNMVTQQKNQGRSPVYVNVYKHNGAVNYSALFVKKPGGAWVAKHGLTGVGYQTQWAHWLSQGYLTSLVAGIDGLNTHRFAAVWRK